MSTPILENQDRATQIDRDAYQVLFERVAYDFGLSRRRFVQGAAAGLLIAISAIPAGAQERPQRRGGGRGREGGGFGGRPAPVSARVHFDPDGSITVLTGKVEVGQGARAEITEAAAEELRVAPDRIHLVMADTALVPDDGITAGSGTTPRTLPAVRAGCAAAREILIDVAAQEWDLDRNTIEVRDGKVVNPGTNRSLSYAELTSNAAAAKRLAELPPGGIRFTPTDQWKVMGTSVARPNGREVVTGRLQYPSDIVRNGMLYAKMLRPTSYGARLVSIDLEPAKKMDGVIVVRDGGFVGVAAPTSFAAGQAIKALAATAKWESGPEQPSSKDLYTYLRQHAQNEPHNPNAEALAKSPKSLKQTYHVAYIQHAPMEPRAAVAEWSDDGKLTCWTGTQNPFGVRGELARAFNLDPEHVRVIVPDTGGGFGGKHSGECAVEAARIAQAAKRPVHLRWTREEEFTWAYFRPAGVIDMQASLDDQNALTTWYQVNINSGPNAVDTPYRVAAKHTQFVGSAPPLRHGSYRGLASTANTFARECFMDELAALAGVDPLAFRLAHLEEGSRLRAVLEAAAKRFDWNARSKRFDWNARSKRKDPNVGVGIACGTEKGSYVGCCAEVAIDPNLQTISVRHVCQAYECGAIVNPSNLLAQVQGAIMMGIGAALREEMRFRNGKIQNASFGEYRVPRIEDLPATLDVHLLDRKDLPSAGAGETPIICIAPAIANAVHHATGQRMRSMPMKLEKA